MRDKDRAGVKTQIVGLDLNIGGSETLMAGYMPVTPVPQTSGGPSLARIKAASGTNATSVKASAGQVYGWYLYNNTASVISLHLYNTAGTPTAGSGTPLFTVPIPANGGCVVEFDMGIPFGTGIGYTITKGATSPSDTDTGSCAADDLHGVLLYK